MKAWIVAVLLGLAACAPAAYPGVPFAAAHGARTDLTSTDLLYVSSYDGRSVSVYNFQSHALVQQLTGFFDPAGLCTDAAGDVYVTTGYNYSIVEYRHGATKPLRYLADQDGFPWSCAVDPKSGDLAVMNGVGLSEGQDGILIYKKARGLPTLYVDSAIAFYFNCAYDRHGNLFFNGENEGTGTLYGELTASKKFVNLTLDSGIAYASGIAWWRDELALADSERHEILRFRITGALGKIVGRTVLDATGIGVFLISQNVVVTTDYDGDTVGFWRFPKGGEALSTLGEQTPQGLALSAGRAP